MLYTIFSWNSFFFFGLLFQVNKKFEKAQINLENLAIADAFKSEIKMKLI